MAEFVYAAGIGQFTLGPGFDTIRFPPEGAALPAAPIVISNFATGPTGDRIDFAHWLAVLIGNPYYYVNPFYTQHVKLEQDGADTIVLVDIDSSNDPNGAPFVPWLRLEGVQMSALTAENMGGYDPTAPTWAQDGKVEPGSAADDLILGLAWHDVLGGAGGNDRIYAGRGNDEVRGGDGDDQLFGEGDQDSLWGGAGADRLEGGLGDDYMLGEAGDDVLLGGDGADSLTDGLGNDNLDGGAGDDQLSSYEGGNDLLAGGAGNDRFYFSRSSLSSIEQNRLEGGEGDDSIYVSAQNRGLIEVDAGTGSDEVEINNVHDELTIRFDPDGGDTVILSQGMAVWYPGATITLEGFAAGDAGPALIWHDFLGRALTGWDGIANPFASGHARVVSIGGRQILEIDPNGGANSWNRVMDLGPDTGQVFTAHNFDGFAPDGSAPVGATFIGTADPEDLTGRNGSDTIAGLDGPDNLYGHAGADIISGGGDNDYVEGGPGADVIDGGDGDDLLLGGQGDDVIHGGAGNDRLEENMVAGAGGSDSLYGDEGDDFFLLYRELVQPAGVHYLNGGEGNDWMLLGVSNSGVVTADGGAGDDNIDISTLRYGASAVVTLGPGQDELGLTGGRFHTPANTSLTVTDFAPGAGGDRIDFGNSFAEWLTGWTAGTNPFASGHLGLSPVAGGARLTIDANGGGDGFITLATLQGVNPLALTADNLDGWEPPIVSFSDADDTIAGTAGTDLLVGMGGTDLFLLQQGGSDAAAGGAGNDLFYFGPAFTADDQADGGDGRDAIVLQGNYVHTFSATNLANLESISVQSGAQTFWGDTANNFYDYDLTTLDANVAADQQMIVNAQSLRAGEDFTFDGSAETDGRFLMYLGHGVDTLTGGLGNDIFHFEGDRFGASDSVDGGAGRDAVVIARGSGLNHIEFGETQLTSIEAISVNKVYSTDPSATPSYELVLANGNVTAGGTLIVNGSSLAAGQTFSVDGSLVTGGGLLLFGGEGNDMLTGGSQADLIFAAGGADTLTGGGGNDTFRYDNVADSTPAARDAIQDFTLGDVIDLSRMDANSAAGGDQAFAFIGTGAFSSTAGELRFENTSGATWLVQGDTDGNGVADFEIVVVVSDADPITSSDFVL